MRTPLAIFLCGFCLTWAVRGRDLETIDELLPLDAAVSLLDHGDLDIPLRDTYHPDFYVASPNGKFYPKFAPGQAMVLMPFAALGKMLTPADAPGVLRGHRILQTALFFGSLVVSLIGVLAYQFWLKLGYPPRASAISAVLLMATSEFLPYSRSLFGDLSCAFLAFAAFYAIFSLKEKESAAVEGWSAMAGACLGFSALIRPVTVLFVAPFAFYLLLIWKRQSIPQANKRRQFFSALNTFLLPCFALLFFNRHAYGSFFLTGYGSEMYLFDQPLGQGVFHILFSPEKGFFVYSPSVLLPILFWKHFHRAHPDESAAALMVSLLYVLVYSTWYANSPGNELSYGQRFLLPVIPFMYLAMPECVVRLQKNIWSALCAGIFILSFCFQIAGCLQTGQAYRRWAEQFQSEPIRPLGQAWMSLQDPSTLAIWWGHDGLLSILSGLILIVFSFYFAPRATRAARFS